MTSAPFPASEPSVLDAPVDNQEDWAAFSRPMASANGATGQWESHLAIAGMHCATCSITIEHALRSVPGVLDASVNGASHLARSQREGELSVDEKTLARGLGRRGATNARSLDRP